MTCEFFLTPYTDSTQFAASKDQIGEQQIFETKLNINEKKRNLSIWRAISFAALGYLSYIPSIAPVTLGSFLSRWSYIILPPIVSEANNTPMKFLRVVAVCGSVCTNYYLDRSVIKVFSDVCVLIALEGLKSTWWYESDTLDMLKNRFQRLQNAR